MPGIMAAGVPRWRASHEARPRDPRWPFWGDERPTASWPRARNVPTKEDGCQAPEVSYSLARGASPFWGIRRSIPSGRGFQTARLPKKGENNRPVRATTSVTGRPMMWSTDR